MLVLSRRIGEKIMIGDDVVVTVVDVRGDTVRLGIAAPRHVEVNRAEMLEAVADANRQAVAAAAEDDRVPDLRRLQRPRRPTDSGAGP